MPPVIANFFIAADILVSEFVLFFLQTQQRLVFHF